MATATEELRGLLTRYHELHSKAKDTKASIIALQDQEASLERAINEDVMPPIVRIMHELADADTNQVAVRVADVTFLLETDPGGHVHIRRFKNVE